ncbi:MAG: exonuclease SbcCD subunit D [Candidatus Zixiibacteriota bacterium]
MRFIHISDTHLGASGFSRKLSPSGYNQREEDICNSFQVAVDRIISLKPDFVLHSGDLFHSVRPTNRIINFAIRQILRIVNLQIPMVIISGNHDTPKQRAVGSVFSFFEVLSPYLYLIYRNEYELIRLDETAIHAIPHCLNQEDFGREMAKIEIVHRPSTSLRTSPPPFDFAQDKSADHSQNQEFNILMLHGVVAGIPEFSMGELAEQEIQSSYLEMPFDYVALGHYHRFCEISPRVYYAGSTERLSMAELGQEKGFVEIQINPDSEERPPSAALQLRSGQVRRPPQITITFHKVPAREMIELPSINARNLDQEQVLREIENRIQVDDILEKIVRLKVKDIPEHIYKSLDFREIAELKSKAFHFDLRFERKEEEGKSQAAKTSIGKLNVEFEHFLNQIPVENLQKDRLLELGLKYLTANASTVDGPRSTNGLL